MQEAISDNKIPITDLTARPETEFESLKAELSGHNSLMDVLAWAKRKPAGTVHPHIVAEVITQDEFTHDIIVPYGIVFLVYDTT